MGVRIDISGALERRKEKTGEKDSYNSLHTKTGVGRQTLASWDRGESLKTIEDLVKIAEFFGEDINQLIVKTQNK